MIVRSFLAVRDRLSGETGPGMALMAAAAAAMLIVNSPVAPLYLAALHGPLGPLDLRHWVDDGLMTVFFLFVGLEMKRELLSGDLSTPQARRLPVIAALAGMGAPALVYLAVTRGDPLLVHGWAIPAATDIAFASGVLGLLKGRVPPSLILFLTTVAIIDDIGAVAIIASCYSQGLSWPALAAAGTLVVLLALVGRAAVRALWPYLALGLLLWAAVLRSGVHTSIAGIVLAWFIPLGADDEAGPLARLERALSPWVGYAVLPIFAFVNAGVPIGGARLLAPLPLGVAAGLVLGKQAGVFGAMRVGVWLGVVRRPPGTSWLQLYGVSLLAGIGFTMSLFIGALAFADPALAEQARIGTLAGSLLSALAGYTVLRLSGAYVRPDGSAA